MQRVAIVGAGFSGTAMALHLARLGIFSLLIERELVPGRGTAYGTGRPEHLLNVTARRMIVWPDDPGHFARWLAERGGGGAEDYAPRKVFGDYLSEQLALARESIEIVSGEAVAIERAGAGEDVLLADGRRIEADAAVLALGNFRPCVPPGIDPDRLGSAWQADPWFGGGVLSANASVLLVGTGLTAVDAALTLDATGHRGPILALSRRGLLPRRHLVRDAVAQSPEAPRADPLLLLAHVRRRSRAIGWREAVHELRDRTQDLWASASPSARGRFLRHLRPYWDVHRHRIAPAVADTIDRMREKGQLETAAGKIVSTKAEGARAIVRWRRRGEAETETRTFDRIVNCTGPELDFGRAGEPLLDSLLSAGRIRPDACRLGVDVDRDCRIIGQGGGSSPNLSAIGPITRGAFWESIAVADIAYQAARAAARIAA